MCRDIEWGNLPLVFINSELSEFALADKVRQQGIEFCRETKESHKDYSNMTIVITGPIAQICDHRDMD